MTPESNRDINNALRIVETGPDHPGFKDAWECLALCQNPSIRHAMRLAMEETFGPYPPPDRYTDDGEPHWNVTVMAQYLGIQVEKILESIDVLHTKWGDKIGVGESSQLHRIH